MRAAPGRPPVPGPPVGRLTEFAPAVMPTCAAGAVFCRLVSSLFKRVQIGLARRHERVGIGALAVDRLAVLFQPHRHFRLRIGALGHGMDLEQLQAARRAGRAA